MTRIRRGACQGWQKGISRATGPKQAGELIFFFCAPTESALALGEQHHTRPHRHPDADRVDPRASLCRSSGLAALILVHPSRSIGRSDHHTMQGNCLSILEPR
eukprot:GHVU01056157.1.p3 GENE.GHVU01056157.1~~GHVU01056157.1.p3  ORF type:complete len:103 (-),score=3.00 GHVU01056157.1:87-395(-)